MSGTPFQQGSSAANDYTALVFVFQQLLRGIATATLVRVEACTNSGGIVPVGTVDVTLLVNQVDGAGQPVPHKVVYGLPYMRVQGGTDAVILDPKKGDIGIAVFASRDISSVKAAKAQANPGSNRVFNYADGLYVGGVLNGTPAQYVQFSSDGIKVLSPSKVTVQAPDIELVGPVHITGAVTGDSTAVFQGDVTGQGTSLHNHTHPDPQGGNTGPPNP